MRLSKFCLYLPIVLLLFISMSQSYAQPHSHGGRSHTHALPTQGISHRHGNSPIGESASNRVTTSAPANYIADKKGCFHFNENPMLNESLTWTGKCIKGYAEGDGDQKWFLNGKPNGGGNTSLKRGKSFSIESTVVNTKNSKLSKSDIKVLINDCDKLSANPFDNLSNVEGVSWDDLDVEKASQPCGTLIDAKLYTGKLLYQTARLRDKSKNSDAVKLLELAIKEFQYPIAYMHLGSLYEDGLYVNKSYFKAVELYNKGCDAGGILSCFKLGEMYSKGRGVQLDYYKVAPLFKKSCDAGHTNSCFKLGRMYEIGRGVKRDFYTANDLYHKACNGKVALGCEDESSMSKKIWLNQGNPYFNE